MIMKKEFQAADTFTYRDCSTLPVLEQHNDDSNMFLNQMIQQDDTIVPFSEKMHQILQNPKIDHIVSWLPHGRAFRVIDVHKFERIVLPQYYSHSKYASFKRQLNVWGFQRITRNIYFHELFLRGLPHLCSRMFRLKKKGCVQRKIEKVEVPTFNRYSIANPMPPYPLTTTGAPVMKRIISGQENISDRINVENNHATSLPSAISNYVTSETPEMKRIVSGQENMSCRTYIKNHSTSLSTAISNFENNEKDKIPSKSELTTTALVNSMMLPTEDILSNTTYEYERGVDFDSFLSSFDDASNNQHQQLKLNLEQHHQHQQFIHDNANATIFPTEMDDNADGDQLFNHNIHLGVVSSDDDDNDDDQLSISSSASSSSSSSPIHNDDPFSTKINNIHFDDNENEDDQPSRSLFYNENNIFDDQILGDYDTFINIENDELKHESPRPISPLFRSSPFDDFDVFNESY